MNTVSRGLGFYSVPSHRPSLVPVFRFEDRPPRALRCGKTVDARIYVSVKAAYEKLKTTEPAALACLLILCRSYSQQGKRLSESSIPSLRTKHLLGGKMLNRLIDLGLALHSGAITWRRREVLLDLAAYETLITQQASSAT